MSAEDVGQDSRKKKGKGKRAMLTGIAALALAATGAGGAYVYLSSEGSAGSDGKAKEKDEPRLVLKGEEDPYAPHGEGEAEEAAPDVSGEGGSKYRTAYFVFTDDFTSNLKNSAGLIQVSMAASTHRDGRVLLWLKKHELAMRSRILTELADTPEEEVLTPEGKERLQKRLTAAINSVLIQTEGFGGVDAVYFRSLLVQ